MKGPVLLFDLDGTLTDSREGITRCIAHALAAHGRVAPPLAELERYIGPPLHRTFEALVPEAAKEALAAFRERYGTVGLFEKQVYPGIEEALGTLTAISDSMFVATSKPAAYAKRIVEHFDLQRFFRGVYGCEMDGVRADKAELLAYMVTEEGFAPADAVMIGDRSHDIVAARANGMRSIGVTWGFGSHEELTEAGADVVIDAPGALVKAVG
jgi:phosphoglycolate phosphatase